MPQNPKCFPLVTKSKELFNTIAIASREIARETIADSEITVVGDNPHAQLLNEVLQEFLVDATFAVTRMCGTGGVLLKPYTTGYSSEIRVDILPQTRFVPTSIIGKTVTAGYFLADDTIHKKEKIYRIEYHQIDLDTGLYTIEQSAFTKEGDSVPIEVVDEWKHIQPIQYYTGMTRLLFSFLRCPADDKKDVPGWYGVPLDYGSEGLSTLIQGQIARLESEFEKKESWVGIDERLFDTNGNIPHSADKLFKILTVGGNTTDTFWKEFSPTIRETELINGLVEYFKLYEVAIGVSNGMFTKLEGSFTTATEIRNIQRRTFNTIDSLRSQFERAIKELMIGVSAIANVVEDSHVGEYELSFDWDMSMRESSAERWAQLKDGVSMGANTIPEARAYSMNEDVQSATENTAKIISLSDVASGLYAPEEYIAQKEGITIQEARAKRPTLEALLEEHLDG